MALIAIGGFQHETSTFAPAKATRADFEAPDAWPALTRGPDLLEVFRGLNIPLSGFIAEAEALGHGFAPLLWASATPSAHVTDDAFESVLGRLIEDLSAALPVDGVYLDLHGAMVTESHEDGDGEILARVRRLIGEERPLVASLDLHATVTRRMVETASLLVAYRTYPHIDMAETGARAARALDGLLREPVPFRAFRQSPFLIPLTAQTTLAEPMAGIMGRAAALERGAVASVVLAPGFPLADVADCGPSIVVYGREHGAVEDAADDILREIAASESRFVTEFVPPKEAVEKARRMLNARGTGPVILADAQDNPGAGGNADTMGVAKALLEAGVEGALLGVLCDAEAAGRAHAAGAGAHVPLSLGGKSGIAGDGPLETEFEVLALSDGRFDATGPFYGGCRMELGPMALLSSRGLRIVVASRKQQAADQAMFRHLGAEPREATILALKSTVHFRADFDAIARGIIVVEAPGPAIADPAKLPFRRLRPGVRLSPRGETLSPASLPSGLR